MTALRRQDSDVFTRRGVISLWTAGIVALCGLSSFGVISIWLDSARLQHARHAAESAAIAAAHAWLSDDLLRANPAAFETEAGIIRCREAADSALAGYRTTASPLQMGATDPECIWRTAAGVIPLPPAVPAAVRVTIPEAIPPTSPGLARLLSGQPLYAAATAAIENHPAALCPSPDCTIQFLPFAAIENVGGQWTQLIDLQTGTDAWSWNAQERRFEVGADGIPEITVNLSSEPASGTEPRLLPLKFQAVANAPNPLPTHAEIIRSGLNRQCLDGMGLSELKYPATFEHTTLSSVELIQCLAALAEAPCEPRILSLSSVGSSVAASTDPAVAPLAQPSVATLQLLRPVAVRVASLTETSASSVTLTFQPCVLVSTMIRTDLTAPASRCVYSVRLVE